MAKRFLLAIEGYTLNTSERFSQQSRVHSPWLGGILLAAFLFLNTNPPKPLGFGEFTPKPSRVFLFFI
jgi:hypothetical protein